MVKPVINLRFPRSKARHGSRKERRIYTVPDLIHSRSERKVRKGLPTLRRIQGSASRSRNPRNVETFLARIGFHVQSECLKADGTRNESEGDQNFMTNISVADGALHRTGSPASPGTLRVRTQQFKVLYFHQANDQIFLGDCCKLRQHSWSRRPMSELGLSADPTRVKANFVNR